MIDPELVAAIERRHRRKLVDFHKQLFSDRGLRPPGEYDGLTQKEREASLRANPYPSAGPLSSVRNRFATVTIVGSYAPATAFEPAAPEGVMYYTYSVKARNKVTGTAERLDTDELTAWAAAVAGARWAPHLYTAGILSGSAQADRAGRMSTAYFHVFTDSDGHTREAVEPWGVPLKPVAIDPHGDGE